MSLWYIDIHLHDHSLILILFELFFRSCRYNLHNVIFSGTIWYFCLSFCFCFMLLCWWHNVVSFYDVFVTVRMFFFLFLFFHLYICTCIWYLRHVDTCKKQPKMFVWFITRVFFLCCFSICKLYLTFLLQHRLYHQIM